MSLINQTTDPTAYLGMRIQKRFGADFYPGKVADYEVVETAHGRRRLFFVQYDDGDEEHVSLTKISWTHFFVPASICVCFRRNFRPRLEISLQMSSILFNI